MDSHKNLQEETLLSLRPKHLMICPDIQGLPNQHQFALLVTYLQYVRHEGTSTRKKVCVGTVVMALQSISMTLKLEVKQNFWEMRKENIQTQFNKFWMDINKRTHQPN